jgi:hypothetical protein
MNGEAMGSKLSRWLKRVQETQDEEISCSECLDQVSQYVDLELATGEADQHMPQLRQHLDQCQVCSEEYQVLRGLARLEAENDLPSQEELAGKLTKDPE